MFPNSSPKEHCGGLQRFLVIFVFSICFLALTPLLGRSKTHAENASLQNTTWLVAGEEKAFSQDRALEVSEVNVRLNWGNNDEMWGIAESGSTVTVQKNGSFYFSAYADPSCGGCWENSVPLAIDSGDEFIISAGAGSSPVPVEIPSPWIINADSQTDEISGTFDWWLEQEVVLLPNWEEGQYTVSTDGDGDFYFDVGGIIGVDLPYGGDGYIGFSNMANYAWLNFYHYFRTQDLVMDIHYDHDWISGGYEPGHSVLLEVYDSGSNLKAHTTVTTGPMDSWLGASGFATYLDSVEWIPEPPDILPGDIIHGEVDGGSEFTADVTVGLITGSADVGADVVTGSVNAPTMMPGPVDVRCEMWGASFASVSDTVIPNGSDTYQCDFSGTYDIVPGSPLMVMYIEPGQHKVIGDFHPDASYLRIEKYFVGEGNPGVGGNVAFYVRYQNQGEAQAEDVTITDTFTGLDYMSDTSGFSHVEGAGEVSWALGTVLPGEWLDFIVFFEVTESNGEAVSNLVEITTTNPFDMGEPSEKISSWEGIVAPNDTHLEVVKIPWTWHPAAGEEFIYQIEICNSGATGSSILTLTDTLSSNIFVENWWTETAGWIEMNRSDHLLELTLPSISPGTCSVVYILASVDLQASVDDLITNLVEISADNDMEDADNTDEVLHTVGAPVRDLAITGAYAGGSLEPGGVYWVNIDFGNTGNQPISNLINVAGTFPPDTSLIGWESWGTAGVALSNISNHTLEWDVDCGFPGTGATIELELMIDPAAKVGSMLAHTIEIHGGSAEPQMANNYYSFIMFVNQEELRYFPLLLR